MAMEQVALLGTGLMGFPMARNLLAALPLEKADKRTWIAPFLVRLETQWMRSMQTPL